MLQSIRIEETQPKPSGFQKGRSHGRRITARGVIAREPGKPGSLKNFNSAPGPGEALVRILASGVCHTDLSAKNGVFGTDDFPFLLGHEGSGIVEQVGEASPTSRRATTSSSPGGRPAALCRFCLVGQAASLRRQPQRHAEDAHASTVES